MLTTAAVIGLAAAAPAAATTVELAPIKACMIVSPDGGSCFSSINDAQLQTGVFPYAPYYEARALLRFDFSSIPSGATINSARLKLTTQWNIDASLDGTSVRPVADAWTDYDVRWNTPDGVGEWEGGTTFGRMRAVYDGDDGTTVEFDAQNVVENWTSAAIDNNGFLVSNPTGMLAFDGLDADNPPSLEIDYTL